MLSPFLVVTGRVAGSGEGGAGRSGRHGQYTQRVDIDESHDSLPGTTRPKALTVEDVIADVLAGGPETRASEAQVALCWSRPDCALRGLRT